MGSWTVVGSGLTGAVIARYLHERGNKVTVLESRGEVGGNVADYQVDGTFIHRYGPHLFRTNSRRIWDYVNRFTTFTEYRHRVHTLAAGEIRPWPCAVSKPAFNGVPQNFEEACLAQMSEVSYRKFVKGYTEKQWGCDAKMLSVSLCKRIEPNDTGFLFPNHIYQGIPVWGYTSMMQNMLRGIEVKLNTPWDGTRGSNLVFTGGIDAYYSYDAGKLRYRSQQRTLRPGGSFCAQLNYADANEPRIRTISWRHITGGRSDLVTDETPQEGGEEYPFPDDENQRLYQEYARRPTKAIICGRLGEYRYLDMDQAIGRALKICDSL